MEDDGMLRGLHVCFTLAGSARFTANPSRFRKLVLYSVLGKPFNRT
jgi:hypothetical protein